PACVFVSSRRRHTRFSRDWSSDVCSSDLPEALAWDVMEQLCAWAGQAQVHEPLWLVNAVVRRLRAGLRAMDEGAAFELVKPETRRECRDLGEAIRVDAPLPAPRGPRKLGPPAARR